MISILDNPGLSTKAIASSSLFRDGDKFHCAEVCEILDCYMRCDYLGEVNTDLNFCLGQNERIDRLELGFRCTPHFKLIADLEAFCKRYINTYRSLNIERYGRPVVWFWDPVWEMSH